MDQDLVWIKKIKNGALDAFEMLVKKYQNMVVNVAYSLAGNVHDAEDVAQEVFLKVYHNIGNFRGQAKFSSWLYRITINSTCDHLRRRKQNVSSLDEFKNFDIPDRKEERDVLDKELIQAALAQIPLKYRSTLVLKEIEGLSYREIAEALKISIGTVESRIFRGRKMLKGILTRKGGAFKR